MPLASRESVSVDESIVASLASIAPFQDLPDAVLSLLCERSERRSYSAGQTVFSLGQYDGGEFLVVLSGGLRISVADPTNGAMLIEEIGPHHIFGLEIAIAEPDPSSFEQITINAAVESDVIVIDAAEFKALAGERPSLMRNIAGFLAEQLAAVRFKTEAAQSAPAQRVYAALLNCVERDRVDGRWRIRKMPKHRELADRAGVDEAGVAEAVAALIQKGVAQREYPGLIIRDMQAFNRLAR